MARHAAQRHEPVVRQRHLTSPVFTTSYPIDTMRLAIPTESLYAPLTCRADEMAAQSGGVVSIRKGTEEECEQWLANNLVDAALVSIAAYGRGSVIQDYRIVPSTLCVLMGWTNAGSILFAENAEQFSSAAASHPSRFLVQAARIVLDEQYDIDVELVRIPTVDASSTRSHACVIAMHDEVPEPRGLDVSEEWDMTFSSPLPLMLWVCRNDYVLDAGSDAGARMERLMQVTRGCADLNLQTREVRYERQAIGDADLRDGAIQWMWSEDLLECMQQTLQLLFYRQILADIPELKVLGRDEEPSDGDDDNGGGPASLTDTPS
ncbi:MAG: MqnA/MqnD/SBP family protein [Candidatus Kapaibacterium sp.]